MLAQSQRQWVAADAWENNLQAGRLLVLAGVRRLKLDGERHDGWYGMVLLWGITNKQEAMAQQVCLMKGEEKELW